MRKMISRLLVGSMFLAAMLGIALAEEPPAVLPPPRSVDEPRKLRSELEALAAERDAATKELVEPSSVSVERAKLRSQLTDLVKRIGEKKAARPAPAVTLPAAPMTLKDPAQPLKLELPEDFSRFNDRLRAAQNLYRSGQVDAALRVFYEIDLNTLAKEDRLFVRYMSACALRKAGSNKAAALFREIADQKDDSFLADQAVSQLNMMKSIEELETILEQLRSRRKAK